MARAKQAEVCVIGAGMAGLASALFLARAGHQVTVVERDGAPRPNAPDAALTAWSRPGVPQWGNGHAFHGLGRRVIREGAPDLLEALASVGARERRFDAALVDRVPEDDDLVAVQCSRPVFEWVLRRAVEAEPGVRLVAGRSVTRISRDDEGVTGLVLNSGTTIASTWVVDASGHRRSDRLWQEAEVEAPVLHHQRAPTYYYARHFRRRLGFARTSDDFHFGPSGDLGFLRYSVLEEHRGGFVVTINTRASGMDIRGLRDPPAWSAVAEAIPGLRPWVQPTAASPVSSIFSHAGRGNVFAEYDVNAALPGLVAVGDALCQTNPTQGWGVSLALHGAALVCRAIDAAPPGGRRAATTDLTRALVAAVRPFYDAAAAEDRERLRQAAGEDVDVTDPSGALFCRRVLYGVADRDAELHRAAQRRIHLLDPPDLLPADRRMVDRARGLWRSQPAPAPTDGPTRNQIANIIQAAGHGSRAVTSTRGTDHE